ncbi:GNAT family N-acetyltransferase [Pararhodospirillum oryzae]|nr:GNAT family N-acetyltransferase [Pararhodospirillum oryzae]
MPFVLRQEARPEVAGLLQPWAHDRHGRAMDDPDYQYVFFQDQDDRLMGYVILGGLIGSNGCIELVRLVAATPRRGIGRAMLRAIMAHVFDSLAANRLWVSLFSDNTAARHLFAGAGFVLEGKLREAVRGAEGFRSLTLMGMLAREYPSVGRTPGDERAPP